MLPVQNIYNAIITNVAYKCDRLGNVIPILTFDPVIPIKVNYNNEVVDLVTDTIKVSSPHEEFGNDFTIGSNIKIKKLDDYNIQLLPNYDIELPEDYTLKCPICGEELEAPVDEGNIGSCVNRACCGQLREVIFSFLLAIHLDLTFIQRRILDMLIRTGGIITLPQLWNITPDMLSRYFIEEKEIVKYIEAFEASRRHVTLYELFQGLGLFTTPRYHFGNSLNSKYLKIFTNLCEDSKLYGIELISYYQSHYTLFSKYIPHLDDFDKFISLATNRYIFNELCNVFFERSNTF